MPEFDDIQEFAGWLFENFFMKKEYQKGGYYDFSEFVNDMEKEINEAFLLVESE